MMSDNWNPGADHPLCLALVTELRTKLAAAERQLHRGNLGQKIFTHKYLDIECVENGCQALKVGDIEDQARIRTLEAEVARLREALGQIEALPIHELHRVYPISRKVLATPEPAEVPKP